VVWYLEEEQFNNVYLSFFQMSMNVQAF